MTGDAGKPAGLTDSPAADIFFKLARNVAIVLDGIVAKPAPEIVFED